MVPKAIKRVMKRTLVKGALRVRNYVRWYEEEAKKRAEEEHNYDHDDFVYPWLNSIFKKLLNEGGGALRPQYTWGVLHATYLAKTIGIKRISAIEFGVAGGNGLISLERIAEKVEKVFSVDIDVYGFDTGSGLPKPKDYRDLPNLWRKSAFPMDEEILKRRLKKAQLILGLVENTIPSFISSNPAPVAFISFDLDYYSSTKQAFKLLEADQSLLLPRIHCYFDDIMGFAYSDYTGERLAVLEFNASHTKRKISPIYGLKYFLPAPYDRDQWSELIYMAHIFDHDLYGHYDGLVKLHVGGGTDFQST